jgi:hypothetical protein
MHIVRLEEGTLGCLSDALNKMLKISEIIWAQMTSARAFVFLTNFLPPSLLGASPVPILGDGS